MPTSQTIVVGGSQGNLGRVWEDECLIVVTVRVELAGEVPLGVTEEGAKLHTAALGSPVVHVRFTP